jgi:hypothetical protein
VCVFVCALPGGVYERRLLSGLKMSYEIFPLSLNMNQHGDDFNILVLFAFEINGKQLSLNIVSPNLPNLFTRSKYS